MYEVKLINGSEETIINAVTTDIEAPRITGNIKKGINTIDNFSFNILPNNQGYSKIHSLKTLIEVLNTKNNQLEFKGRVLIPVETMDNTGKLYKNVTCESELGYLMDSATVYGEYHDHSVRQFLEVLINNHNSQVAEDKHFIVGNIGIESNLYRFLGYDKTLDAIKDKLLDRLGGELLVRYENGIRYLDYLSNIGEVKSTDIRLSKNLQTIEQEKDPTSIISRLIPLGNKLEDSDERLTIESVNNGLKYIDDPQAIEEFGIVVGTQTWDDVTLPENLVTRGQDYLQVNNKVKKKHKICALDLYTIGLDFDSFEVGNYYPIINPLMAINEDLRVIEKTIDINSPQNSNLTVGDKFEDIKIYQLGISKANRNIVTVSENLSSSVDTINMVNTELNNTVEVVNQTNTILANTNQTVADLTQQIQDNINAIQGLNNTTDTIQINLNNTSTKLQKLKLRMNMEV